MNRRPWLPKTSLPKKCLEYLDAWRIDHRGWVAPGCENSPGVDVWCGRLSTISEVPVIARRTLPDCRGNSIYWVGAIATSTMGRRMTPQQVIAAAEAAVYPAVLQDRESWVAAVELLIRMTGLPDDAATDERVA